MPWYYRSRDTTIKTTASTSHSVSLPPLISKGDLIVMAVGLETPATIPPPTGFTSAGNVSNLCHVFWKRATGAESNQTTISLTVASKAVCFAVAYAGLDTRAVANFAVEPLTGARTSVAAPAIGATTSNQEDLGIQLFYAQGAGTWTVPTSDYYRDRYSASNNQAGNCTLAYYDDILETADDVTGGVGTFSTATELRAISLVFNRNLITVIRGARFVESDRVDLDVGESTLVAGVYDPIETSSQGRNLWLYRMGFRGRVKSGSVLAQIAAFATGQEDNNYAPSKLLAYSNQLALGAATADTIKGIVAGDELYVSEPLGVYLRSEPRYPSSAVLAAALPQNTRLTATGSAVASTGTDTYKWVPVRYANAYNGYVAADFVSKVAGSSSTTTNSRNYELDVNSVYMDATIIVGRMATIKTTANLHEAADPTSSQVAQLPVRQVVKITDGPVDTNVGASNAQTWWRILAKLGTLVLTGWIDAAQLQIADVSPQDSPALPYSSNNHISLAIMNKRPGGILIQDYRTEFPNGNQPNNINLYGDSISKADLVAATVIKDGGQLSLWYWAEENRPPTVEPISPINFAEIRSTQPVIQAQFKDLNGKFGEESGLGADRGDRLMAYQIKLFRSDNLVNPIWDTGVVSPTATEIATGLIQRQCEIMLENFETYGWQIAVQDMYGAWSGDLNAFSDIQYFTPALTGPITLYSPTRKLPGINQNPGDTGVGNPSYYQQTGRPSFQFTWEAYNNLPTQNISLQISTSPGFEQGTIIEEAVNLPFTANASVPGNTQVYTITWMQLGFGPPPGTHSASGFRLAPGRYYWRMKGKDTAGKSTAWTWPESFEVTDSEAIALLRANDQRYRMYFVVWDQWQFSQSYPKLTWLRGKDPDSTPGVVFPGGDQTRQTGSVVIGIYGESDYHSVVNIGPNRLAFVGDPISFDATRSWQRGTSPGKQVPQMTFAWTFPGATPSSASGPGPHAVTYAHPGLYEVSCIEYSGSVPVTAKRKVRVLLNREQSDYDVVSVGGVSGGKEGGWKTDITIQQREQLPGYSADQISFSDFQSVGIFIEEERYAWNGDIGEYQWVRRNLSGYPADPALVLNGYIQQGSLRVDANTHSMSFTIVSLAEQMQLGMMYATQTWWQPYFRNVQLKAAPESIAHGSTLTLPQMKMIDVILHLLQKFTNVLERHDFLAWYDSSLQSVDTASTTESPIWSGLQSMAESEYAWLFVDQGGGLNFLPNPSLRSWGEFDYLYPRTVVLEQDDIMNIDIQQLLMQNVNFCQVVGNRPYNPQYVYQATYPTNTPAGQLGQWLVKTNQRISAQWFAEFMAENFFWDANRRITGTITLPLNRYVSAPGRVVLKLQIPSRGIDWNYKEFYVTNVSYSMQPGTNTWTTQLTIIERMWGYSGKSGPRGEINVYTNAAAARGKSWAPAIDRFGLSITLVKAAGTARALAPRVAAQRLSLFPSTAAATATAVVVAQIDPRGRSVLALKGVVTARALTPTVDLKSRVVPGVRAIATSRALTPTWSTS